MRKLFGVRLTGSSYAPCVSIFENPQCRKPSFREYVVPEAPLPRIKALGIPLNRGNGAVP